jgi:hypothetical protein
MECGNGTPTGIAINPTTKSNKLVLAFEGGGACWEAANCYGIVVPVTASHLDGFNEGTFNSIRSYFDSHWAFQRGDATSLFADATWVFVPYCTGDLHAGTQTTVYEALGQQATMHHVGGKNVDAMLDRIKGFDVSEVFLMGISAGGYGAQLNWDRIAKTFPSVTTHLLADGAQLVPIESGRWGTMNQRWAMRFPEGCTACSENLDRLGDFWHSAKPPTGGRYGLLNSLQDNVLSLFFGYDAAGMKTASLAVGQAFDSDDEGAFMVDITQHTLLNLPDTQTSTSVKLRPWVEAWARGEAAYTPERPYGAQPRRPKPRRPRVPSGLGNTSEPAAGLTLSVWTVRPAASAPRR